MQFLHFILSIYVYKFLIVNNIFKIFAIISLPFLLNACGGGGGGSGGGHGNAGGGSGHGNEQQVRQSCGRNCQTFREHKAVGRAKPHGRGKVSATHVARGRKGALRRVPISPAHEQQGECEMVV